MCRITLLERKRPRLSNRRTVTSDMLSSEAVSLILYSRLLVDGANPVWTACFEELPSAAAISARTTCLMLSTKRSKSNRTG